MTTIIRAADEAQFLSLIPRMLGFVPHQSLVLLPFHGTRTGGGLRLDLPETTDATELARLASCFLGLVCRVRGVDGVAIAVYVDAPYGAAGPPHAQLVRALRRAAHSDGLRILGALCVAADAWGCYAPAGDTNGSATGDGAEGVDRCPPAGWPLERLTAMAPDTSHLPTPEADQDSGAELPHAEPAQAEQVARAYGLLVEEFFRGRIERGEDAVHEMFADLVDLADGMLEEPPDTLSPVLLAALVFALDRPLTRDVLIATWCFDDAFGKRVLVEQLRWRPGDEFPAELGLHMMGEGPPPRRERLRAALELARWIAAVTPHPQQAGALATCGWLAWALGRSSHAHRYATMALEREPTHGLAGIVSEIVAAGHLPSWWFDAGGGRYTGPAV